MSKTSRRSDYETVRATARDLHLLRWIGDQFAVDTSQLKVLMNRWKRFHEPDWNEASLSDETVKRLLVRWRKAGWIENRKLLAHRPQWVWLSKIGLDDMGLSYPYRTPAVGRLNHIYHVNMVRLYTEGRLGNEAEWISERQVNAERKADDKKHLVDGEVVYQDTVIGIEVEQTQKTKRRLASILYELQEDYVAVWYFVAEVALGAVEEMISKREGTDDQKDWRTFVIYPMSHILSKID